MNGSLLLKCCSVLFSRSVLLFFLLGGLYSPYSHASIWDLFSHSSGGHQDTITKDSHRIEVTGTVPADSELELIGFYYSSICTEKEMYFPSGDIVHPKWRTKGTTSQLRKVISSTDGASNFTLSLALHKGGRCQWKLTNININMSILPNHHLWRETQSLKEQYLAELPVAKRNNKEFAQKNFEQSFNLIPVSKPMGSAKKPKGDSIEPIYYPVYIYDNNTHLFNVKLKSNLQREVTNLWDMQNEAYISLSNELVTQVNFNPLIDENYALHVYLGDKKAKVLYPDETAFTYPIADLRLYPYGSPESRFKSLLHSSRIEDKKKLANIYNSGILYVFEADKIKAEALYRELGEAGDMEAIDWLRERAGWGYIKDGQYWLERAAKLGNLKAKLELINQPLSVILHEKNNVGKAKIHELQAWKELTKLAGQGIAEAKSQMALYQVLSYSPYYDAAAALDNYRQSVKIQPDLASDAAETYYYIKDDFAQAEEFWVIAAERDLYAAAMLADVLLSDEHKNAYKARYWLAKVTTWGAKQGLEINVLGKAYFQLASLLDKGEGGEVDANAALGLYRQSLEIASTYSSDYQVLATQRVKELEASVASK